MESILWIYVVNDRWGGYNCVEDGKQDDRFHFVIFSEIFLVSHIISQVRETQPLNRAKSLAPTSRSTTPCPDPFERPWSSASNYNECNFSEFLTSLPLGTDTTSSTYPLRSQYRQFVLDGRANNSEDSEAGRDTSFSVSTKIVIKDFKR